MTRQATATTADSQWQLRIRNALLLSVCADAIAAPFNSRPLPDPVQVDAAMHNQTQHPHSFGVTQALVLAEHLAVNQGKLVEDDLALALAKQWSIDQTSDPQAGATDVLADIHHGTPWWEAAPAYNNRQGSAGNGAAVRATPIGLVPGLGLGTVALLARRSATVTHTHPHARDAAAVQALAVALAAHGHPSYAIDATRFLTTIGEHTRTPEMRAALGIVRTLVRHRAGPAEVAATVGNDSTALRSVPAALTAFLRHPSDPTAALRFAVLIGGQTQAITAMTAAIAGANHPNFAPPSNWRPLPNTIRVRTAAAALSDIGKPA